MTTQALFFAQPLFRKASPDFQHIGNLPRAFTLDTPRAGLALAADYYRIEAYASEADRDAACGQTAHPDVNYVPIAKYTILDEEIGDVACGYALDHSQFDEVFTALFPHTLHRLIEAVVNSDPDAEGLIATEALSIARTRYTIEAIAYPDCIRFEVEGLALFEERRASLIESTCEFLHRRMYLHLAGSGENALN